MFAASSWKVLRVQSFRLIRFSERLPPEEEELDAMFSLFSFLLYSLYENVSVRERGEGRKETRGLDIAQ